MTHARMPTTIKVDHVSKALINPILPPKMHKKQKPRLKKPGPAFTHSDEVSMPGELRHPLTPVTGVRFPLGSS